MKQVDLQKYLPDLIDDLRIPELFCRTGEAVSPHSTTSFLWIGPCGAVTGLHNDDENNVLICLAGRKRVLLAPPSASGSVYENSKYDEGTRCCDVDPEAPDLSPGGHPLFEDVPVTVAELGPGDVLFVPRYWYHHVRTTAPASISVNVFASTRWELLRDGSLRCASRFAHEWLGLWRGRCVCHASTTSDSCH